MKNPSRPKEKLKSMIPKAKAALSKVKFTLIKSMSNQMRFWMKKSLQQESNSNLKAFPSTSMSKTIAHQMRRTLLMTYSNQNQFQGNELSSKCLMHLKMWINSTRKLLNKILKTQRVNLKKKKIKNQRILCSISHYQSSKKLINLILNQKTNQ